MIQLADLTAELQKFWSAASPVDVTTQFPGVLLDATQLDQWYEFWLTHVEGRPGGASQGEMLTLLIDVHCFSRQPEKRKVFELADAVRRALSQQTLSLRSTADPAQTIGTLRLYEATIRDLSRESPGEPGWPLQHVLVTLAARAERIVAVPNV